MEKRRSYLLKQIASWKGILLAYKDDWSREMRTMDLTLVTADARLQALLSKVEEAKRAWSWIFWLRRPSQANLNRILESTEDTNKEDTNKEDANKEFYLKGDVHTLNKFKAELDLLISDHDLYKIMTWSRRRWLS